jgi:hypothetical protein
MLWKKILITGGTEGEEWAVLLITLEVDPLRL